MHQQRVHSEATPTGTITCFRTAAFQLGALCHAPLRSGGGDEIAADWHVEGEHVPHLGVLLLVGGWPPAHGGLLQRRELVHGARGQRLHLGKQERAR